MAQAGEAFHIQTQQGTYFFPAAVREISVISGSGVVDQKGLPRRKALQAGNERIQGGFVRQVAGKDGGVKAGMAFF